MMQTKQDWELVRKTATDSINQAELNIKINKKILKLAEKEIKKYPEEDETTTG